ncbi:hypothetical protein BC835DRAFT_31457 [Cytidiella melzeri]|nr:hypothetical protein BC835DRAFT_31457 [Cytidiella melzeri]
MQPAKCRCQVRELHRPVLSSCNLVHTLAQSLHRSSFTQELIVPVVVPAIVNILNHLLADAVEDVQTRKLAVLTLETIHLLADAVEGLQTTRYHHVESEGPRHDPTSVVRTHTRERSRSDPRSRSRSPSRQVPVVIQPSGHIQQPILVPQSDRRRSRSRSPHTAPPFVAHARSSDRPGQPIIIRTERPGSVEGDRGHRHSRSPYSRRRSRSPGGTRFFSRSRRSRSRSPTRTHRVSRSPTRHSYSPARTHSVSRSPTRHSRSRTTRRSRSPVHRVSRSPTRHSRSRITRRSRSPAHRVSRSPTRHDYPRSVIGRRRSSRSPTQRAHSGHMSPTSRDYSSSPTRRRRVARSSSQHDESRSPTRRGSPSRRPAMVEDDRGHPSSRRSPIRRTHTERSRSPVTHRVARSRTPPLQLGSTGRSPRVIRTQGTYRSRSPTLVGTQVEPIRLQVGSSTRSPGYEDPTRRIHRSPTDYSEHEEPHGRRLARRPGSRSPSPRRRESEILPVRPPSRIRTHPARGGPPTVITLPGDRTHTPPSSPSPRIIQVPSSPRPRRGRDRIPSDVTHRPYSRSVERTPAAGPIRDSSPHSQVSELEHAFSVDEPIAPSRRVPSSRRRVSPTADLRDQLRPARPDVPVIPYIPSVSRVEEPQVSVPASHGVPSERLTSQSASPVPVPAPIPSEQDPRTVPTTHIRTGHSPSSHVPAAVLPPSPPHAPVMIVPSHTYSGPHDLDYADAERERAERFEQAQMQIGQHLQAAEEAEEQRERDFRENEEARQRIFEENEARRQQELQHHQDEYLRQIDDRVEDRLAGLPTVTPLPVPPPHEGPAPYAPSGMSLPSRRSSISASIAPSRLEADQGLPVMPPPSSPEAHIEDMGDVHSIAQSLHHSVLDAASRHSQDMLETLRLEREEMHRQLDEERLERERRQAELAAVRDQRESDLMERIRHLEDRLAATESAHEQTKADLEQERQVRITEETERREAERDEDRQRAEDAALQLSELTNVATATRDELARKREVSDERWATKEVWKEQKDRDVSDMKDMLSNMQRMFEDCERRREEERAAEAGKPSIESVLQELKNENATLRQLFAELAEGLRADSQRHLEEILGAVRSTAQEQVPFNISGYLDEFSKTLAKEVRQLLTEVNELVENKTRLQFEIATLMEFKAN